MSPLPEPFPRVLVLHQEIAADAPPDERDTLVQAEAVEEALHALGYDTARLRCGLDLGVVGERLRTLAPVVVFNLVESLDGLQRLASLAPALLEALDIPFTGNGSQSMRVSGDKLRSKRLLREAGLPTPDWLVPDDLAQGRGEPCGTWILKPASEDASTGLRSDSALTEGARLARDLHACRHRQGGQWFAERYIDGREFNIALLQGEEGLHILPLAEMLFLDFPPGRARILDYAAKWEPESFSYRHTRRHFAFDPSEAPLLERLGELGRACWELFGLAGYARVDIRVDGEGAPWILEVNANPCLAPDAGFMAAARVAGLGLEEVVGRLVRAALDAPDHPLVGVKRFHVSHP